MLAALYKKMIPFTEYKQYYQLLTAGILGGNEGNLAIMQASNIDVSQFTNYRSGLIILSLVAFTESNFFEKSDFKLLRNFDTVENFPIGVHQLHLSCYIYIRDCFAHNPKAVMFSGGRNTEGFKLAVNSGQFNAASITGNEIKINESCEHSLHMIIRALYEQMYNKLLHRKNYSLSLAFFR